MEGFLKDVRDFADRAHGDQLRKYTPERYIVHPIRVMTICQQCQGDENMLAAALLHDVIEDTPLSRSDIHSFLTKHKSETDAEDITKLVVELTDIYEKKNYPQWNRKKRKSKEAERMAEVSGRAQTIKYADILDNCTEIVEFDPQFARVFIRECSFLIDVMKKGDAELRKRVREVLSKLL